MRRNRQSWAVEGQWNTVCFDWFLLGRRTQSRFFTGKSQKKFKLTEQANRGNVNDCFDPFGTKSSPPRIRTPGSPAVATPESASMSVPVINLLGTVPVSCGQKTALATFETNVLLLRRAPYSLLACEPSAMVRRRHKLGALENKSSACASVLWRVRNRGIGELTANVNWSYCHNGDMTKRCHGRTGVAIASCVRGLLAQRCCDDGRSKDHSPCTARSLRVYQRASL